jgi:hypothetical protein
MPLDGGSAMLLLMAHAQSTLLYAVDIPTLQTLRPLHRHKRCQKALQKRELGSFIINEKNHTPVAKQTMP